MVKLDTLQKIVGPGLVAVIRAASSEQAAPIAHACVDGGIQALDRAHSISGDINRVSVKEVRSLQAGDGSGRVQR